MANSDRTATDVLHVFTSVLDEKKIKICIQANTCLVATGFSRHNRNSNCLGCRTTRFRNDPPPPNHKTSTEVTEMRESSNAITACGLNGIRAINV